MNGHDYWVGAGMCPSVSRLSVTMLSAPLSLGVRSGVARPVLAGRAVPKPEAAESGPRQLASLCHFSPAAGLCRPGTGLLPVRKHAVGQSPIHTSAIRAAPPAEIFDRDAASAGWRPAVLNASSTAMEIVLAAYGISASKA